MAAVTLNARTYSDDADPVTGLANGGHRARFVPCLSDMLIEIGKQVADAKEAYRAVSTTTLTVGSGPRSLIVTINKAFSTGDGVVIQRSADPGVMMLATVTAFTAASGSMTVSIAAGDFQGSGSFSDWTVTGPIGPRGAVGLSGWSYLWDAGTSGDPGPGDVGANTAILASATSIRLDVLDATAKDLTSEIASWGGSTSAIKGVLTLRSRTDQSRQITYNVTAVTNSGGFFTLTTSYRGGAAGFAGGDPVSVAFQATGDRGDVGLGGPAGTVSAAGDGIISTPGIGFVSEPGLGLRRKSAGVMAVVANASDLVELRAASLAEAQAGTSALALMTPQRTADAISALASSRLIRSARSSNTILGAADIGRFIDITSGSFTQTFMAAAMLTSGWWVRIRNGGTGDITLDPNGVETIDGLTSFIMYPGEVRDIQCDGVGFTSILLTGFNRRFTSGGVWVKPPGYACFHIDAVGGGGGGGGGEASYCGGGGGGGARVPVLLQSTAIPASVTITIGSGGAGGFVVGGASGGNGIGIAGGTTSFGPYVTAFGGGPGANGPYGSSGGGSKSAGSYANAGGDPAASGGGFGSASTNSTNNLSTGGGGSSAYGAAGNAEWGGGAGGKGETNGNYNPSSPNTGAGGEGGSSIFGPAGGGGGATTPGIDARAGGDSNKYTNGGGGAPNPSGHGSAGGTNPITGMGRGGGGGSYNRAGGAGGFPGGGGGGGGAGNSTNGGGAGGAGQLTIVGIV